MRLGDPSSGLTGSELEAVQLEGESLSDLRTFWERSAETDAIRAIADAETDETFEESGRREAVHLNRLLPDGGTALDVGCGIGRVISQLAAAAAADGKRVRIHGLDIAAAMVEQGRERLAALDNVELHHGNGYDLGAFDGESFELVYSAFAFQHMPKPIVLNYFAEVHRVLRPEGAFWFQVPNVLQDEHMHALNHFSQPWYVEHPYPMHFYTAFEVVKMLRYRHFAVERLEEGMKVWARKTEGPWINDDVIAAVADLSWGPLGAAAPRPRRRWPRRRRGRS